MATKRSHTGLTLVVLFLHFAVCEVVGAAGTEKVHIQTTVTAWVEYKVLKEKTTIKVAKKDIDRGYKHINAGTIISVSTNSTDGYYLSIFCKDRGFLQSISVILGSGSYLVYPGNQVDILLPYKGSLSDVTQVDYRFYLSAEAQITEYLWPIEINVRP